MFLGRTLIGAGDWYEQCYALHIWHISDKYIRDIYIYIQYICSFLVYIRNIYILSLALRFRIVVFVLFASVWGEWCLGVGREERWRSMTREMMRIARYCTSVLISGRTIPADVRLLIPHCGFMYRRSQGGSSKSICPSLNGYSFTERGIDQYPKVFASLSL